MEDTRQDDRRHKEGYVRVRKEMTKPVRLSGIRVRGLFGRKKSSDDSDRGAK